MRRFVGVCGTAIGLAACGGGGGGGAAVEPVPLAEQPAPAVTFNVEAAIAGLLGTGQRFSGLSTAAQPGLTLDWVYAPSVPRTVDGVTLRRTRFSPLARDNGVPVYLAGPSEWLDYTAPPVNFAWRIFIDPLPAPMTYQSTGALPTAAAVGTSGPFNLGTEPAGTSGTTSTATTWSVEAADSPATAWACLNTVTTWSQGRSDKKECYRIDPAGTIRAARITLPVGTQTLTFQ